MKTEESFGVIPLKKESGAWLVFLVQLKSGSHWGYPKGHKEEGEAVLDTIARELFEETHLSIDKFLETKPLQETYVCEKGGEKISKTVTYYLAEVKGDPDLQRGEILDGGWFTLDAAAEKITYPGSKQILKCVKDVLV